MLGIYLLKLNFLHSNSGKIDVFLVLPSNVHIRNTDTLLETCTSKDKNQAMIARVVHPIFVKMTLFNIQFTPRWGGRSDGENLTIRSQMN